MKRNLLLIATGMLVAIAVLAALRATAWPFDDGETPTLAPLLERVTPAVVNIAVVGHAEEGRNPLLEDPVFRRFFGGPDAPLAPPSMPRQSIGSGVIIDGEEGLVVTNHHVVQGADSIVVTLADRREFNATLVGSDAGTDIALLRVAADDANLAEIPVGDSSSLAFGRVSGVWVSAVAPGSATARFGLRADDVITAVNWKPVGSVGQLTAALNGAAPPIALQVQRQGRALFLLVR